MTEPVSETLRPMISSVLGKELPVRIRFWDGSSTGADNDAATIVVRSPKALRYLLYSPNELGIARAYVAGELDVEGDIYRALDLRDSFAGSGALGAAGSSARRMALRRQALRAGLRLGAIGAPPPPPQEEIALRGRRHSQRRDAQAIAHHYDISNDFYRLVLGETMTYSCAYFTSEDCSLDDAQRAKYDLICRKLGLQPGMRLLDVGCGWGGMIMHAAQNYGVQAVGITISKSQAELAQKRIAEAGLAGLVTIRLEDYRDLSDGPYDAISSIGMFEHVGKDKLAQYFSGLRALLRPGGRLLNHAIGRPGGQGGRAAFVKNSFIDRYVFPDGELHEVGSAISIMQECDLEVRDLESLREHYARTLRAWVANLENEWDRAVALVGAGRARVWRLYMAASALNFDANRTTVHQVLATRNDDTGKSGMPMTRAALLSEKNRRGSSQFETAS